MEQAASLKESLRQRELSVLSNSGDSMSDHNPAVARPVTMPLEKGSVSLEQLAKVIPPDSPKPELPSNGTQKPSQTNS